MYIDACNPAWRSGHLLPDVFPDIFMANNSTNIPEPRTFHPRTIPAEHFQLPVCVQASRVLRNTMYETVKLTMHEIRRKDWKQFLLPVEKIIAQKYTDQHNNQRGTVN